jgi:hypothetical protein
MFAKSPTYPISVTDSSFCIEAADGCDGCLCDQPLFDYDGSLHIVRPHYHLVEWNGVERRYHPVLLSDSAVSA